MRTLLLFCAVLCLCIAAEDSIEVLQLRAELAVEKLKSAQLANQQKPASEQNEKVNPFDTNNFVVVKATPNQDAPLPPVVDAEKQELAATGRRLHEENAGIRGELEALKLKLAAAYQEIERLKTSTKTSPGLLIQAISTNGEHLTMRDGSCYDIAATDMAKTAKWASTDTLSFLAIPDLSKTGAPVYKIENWYRRETVLAKWLDPAKAKK